MNIFTYIYSFHIVGELPEALAMKEKDWEAKYNFKKIQPNDTIILYCRSGKRSDTASQILEARGFKHILNYEGSYIDWFGKSY